MEFLISHYNFFLSLLPGGVQLWIRGKYWAGSQTVVAYDLGLLFDVTISTKKKLPGDVSQVVMGNVTRYKIVKYDSASNFW